jgi:homocysteine S-methyltransferase
VLLDGGLSTELEHRGHDVSGALWSARLLRDEPDAVVAAHRAFLDAGARVITTASYQATFEGFASAGLDRDEAELLLRRSVALARRAVDEAGLAGRAWVAASVGPYGAMLADGSEYTGAYAAQQGVAGLRRFHRPRLEVLADAGADVLACETVPALAEAEALVAEVDRLGVPAWLSLTTVASPAGSPRTRLDEDAVQGFALARSVDAVIAVGVNCTEPAGVAAAVQEAATASGKPAVAYPNSGERWDARARTWRGDAALAVQDVRAWLGRGARLVGGCCRIGPAAIRTIAAAAREDAGPDDAGRDDAAGGGGSGGPRR